MWRKNRGIASGAVLEQGDANGDGTVDGIDYEVWRNQYNTPAAGGGTGAVAAGESNQVVSTSPASAVSVDLAASKDVAKANDAVFGSLLMKTGHQDTSPRRSAEHVRSLAAAPQRDWSELLNDLAVRRARREILEQSANLSHSRSANDVEATDGETEVSCLVKKSLSDV